MRQKFTRLAIAAIVLVAAGCATTTNQHAVIESLAEKAGIVCYTYLPGHRVEIQSICAIAGVISPDLDPATVQKTLQDQIASLWVAGGETGAWLVSTTLNDLVRFTGLNDKIVNSDSVKRWSQAMTAFCSGVEIAGK